MAGKGNGGAETYAADMILALHEMGIEQQVAMHPRQARLEGLRQAGIAVRPDLIAGWWNVLRRRRLRQAIMAFQPDLVHCWMRRASALVPALPMPVIGWFGGYYDVRHFTRCSHFIGVTPDIVAHQRNAGVAVGRSFFVPTFPVTPPLADAVALPPLPLDGMTVLLTLSRLHPKKGLDTLLDALALLPDCVLWLAGDGPEEARLRAQAQRLGIKDRVQFLGWRTDRGALLRAADICVLPSRYEPFGTVMLEAWASGTPLIAAAAAGPAAFVRDGENGLLVPVDDAGALAAAIQRLQQNKLLRGRMIVGGRVTYETHFTRDAVRQQMRDVYEQILTESADGAANA